VIFARVEKKLVIVPFVEKRLVELAFVVVLFPTIRSVIVANVATRFEIKLFVEVLLFDVRPPKLPFVALKLSV
jgi:hypothetical protein